MATNDPVQFIQPAPYNLSQIGRDLIEGMSAAAFIVKADFKLTYWNWDEENQPKWEESGPKPRGGDLVWIYTTESTPFIWVDLGTEGPYTIEAVNFPRLKFQTGFIPKTRPGGLISSAGGSFGPWTSPMSVEHPGIEPREFSVEVKDNADEHLPSLMAKAIKIGLVRTARTGSRVIK